MPKIDDLIGSANAGTRELRFRYAPETLAKVEADLRRVVEAKASGLVVPTAVRLSAFFKSEYGVAISDQTIRRAILKLSKGDAAWPV